MFGLIVFTKAEIGDTNLKLYMRRYTVNSSGPDCKSGVERLWECKSLAAHQYMHGYPSGDGDGLISHLPSVRFSPRVPAIATCIEQANSTNVKPAAKFTRLRLKRVPCLGSSVR